MAHLYYPSVAVGDGGGGVGEEEDKEEEEKNRKLMDTALCHMTQYFTQHKIEPHHGWQHVLQVYFNARDALNSHECVGTMTRTQKTAILLAALCHEHQDRKFFPLLPSPYSPPLSPEGGGEGEGGGGEESKQQQKQKDPYTPTRNMLNYLCIPKGVQEDIIDMISLCSVSKRGLTKPDKYYPPYYYIPSDADRLESIGIVGIKRCIEYTMCLKRPFVVKETALPETKEELLTQVVLPQRLDDYVNKNNGKSVSMLDHFYDKLLHLGTQMDSANNCLVQMAHARHRHTIYFVLQLCAYVRKTNPPMPMMSLPDEFLTEYNISAPPA